MQCPLNSECRPIAQCANQSELKLNTRKLNYCGWRYGLPMICCSLANLSRNSKFQNEQPFINKQNSVRLKNKRKGNYKNYEICGTRIKQISLYIVGGSNVVSATKYPWFASVALVKDESYLNNQDDKKEKNSNLHHYCGSTIISDQFLIR